MPEPLLEGRQEKRGGGIDVGPGDGIVFLAFSEGFSNGGVCPAWDGISELIMVVEGWGWYASVGAVWVRVGG